MFCCCRCCSDDDDDDDDDDGNRVNANDKGDDELISARAQTVIDAMDGLRIILI